jgi:hypothetical protein
MDGGGDPQNRRPMIWDEKRQDRELFAFFQRLIALRQEYAAVISEAVIAYRKLGDADCWTLGAEGALSMVYTGERPFPSDAEKAPGRLIFSAACGDSPPPHSVAVYAGDVQEPSP